jgi:hypothetical protein
MSSMPGEGHTTERPTRQVTPPGVTPRRWLRPCQCGLAAAVLVGAGCESAMERVDRRVDSLLAETGSHLGGDATWPTMAGLRRESATEIDQKAASRTDLSTVNPSAASMRFEPSDEARDVNERLRGYAEPQAGAAEMDLRAVLEYAIRNSREYRFAEEEYVLAALRLLTERHRWGPRFFDEVEAAASASAEEGLYDASLALVNEFRVTQRLPYGGEISARALARATEDLHRIVAGEDVQDAEVICFAGRVSRPASRASRPSAT